MKIEVEIPDDLTTLSPEAARELLREADGAIAILSGMRPKLDTLGNAEIRIDEIASSYLDARDGNQPPAISGTPKDAFPKWKQPLGAFDAYPKGYVVLFDSKLFTNTIPFNVHKPTAQNGGWDETDLDDAPPPPDVPDENAYPTWVSGVAYKVGEKVWFEGTLYEVVQAHTSQPGWTPVVVPALWKVALP